MDKDENAIQDMSVEEVEEVRTEGTEEIMKGNERPLNLMEQ